jgi:phosphatidylglycerol:prolipoprotein diacylglycerol transferase
VEHYFVQSISPIAFHIGPLVVRWYGLAYLAGLFIGIKILKRLIKSEGLLRQDLNLDSLLTYLTLGVIIGGRMGEVLFYSPEYYFAHPLQVFAVWKGGMSSHGGFIGVLIATALFCRKHRVNFLVLMDAVAFSAPPGIFLGRLANFINSEMPGKVTHVPWAVIFPVNDLLPRHPVQIYQALTEGPVLLLLLFLFPYPRYGYGTRCAFFAIAYGILRFITEYFRAVDPGYLGYYHGLTEGQLLSLGMIAVGVVLFVVFNHRKDGLVSKDAGGKRL